MIDQVPRELAALIAAERAAPTASSAVRLAVRAKVAAAVAGAPLGVAATGLGAGKVIAIVALAIGAGTATVVGVKARGARAEVAHAEPMPAVRLAAPPPPVTLEALAPVVAAPGPVAVARARPVVHAPVPSQAERIQQAWSALSANDPAGALEVVERDAHEHPIGVLSEEREAVKIVALARLGKLDDARRAAAAFRNHYPSSIHLELITRSLGEESP